MKIQFIFRSLVVAACLSGGGLLAQSAPPATPPSSPELVPDAAPTDGSMFRIALMADVHTDLTDQGESVRFLPHLQTTIHQVNDANVDVVLIAGDLANFGKKPEWDAFKTRIRGFKAPVFYVPGNHDIMNKVHNGKKDLVGVTSESYARYVGEMGPGFFVKEAAGIRVVGLAGSLFGSGLPEEEQQWTMLEHALGKPSSMPTVAFCHYPLFKKSMDEPGGVYWNIEPEARHRLLALMKTGGVAAFLTGHLHHAFVADAGGLPCIGAPAVAWGIPAATTPEGWTLVAIPKSAQGAVQSYIHYIPH